MILSTPMVEFIKSGEKYLPRYFLWDENNKREIPAGFKMWEFHVLGLGEQPTKEEATVFEKYFAADSVTL